MDPEKRAIGNAVQVFYKEGSATSEVEVNYPVGHRRRRSEGIPLLIEDVSVVMSRIETTGEMEDFSRLGFVIEAISEQESQLF